MSISWNEITELEIVGPRIAAKDAMIMLSLEDDEPDVPVVTISPGPYVAEIHLESAWHALRFRIAPRGSNPERGQKIGTIDVDHAKAAFVDYDRFLKAGRTDPESYEEWTAMELDDELALNFSGIIEFADAPLVYVKSGNGDGSYPVYELLSGGIVVGMECAFE